MSEATIFLLFVLLGAISAAVCFVWRDTTRIKSVVKDLESRLNGGSTKDGVFDPGEAALLDQEVAVGHGHVVTLSERGTWKEAYSDKLWEIDFLRRQVTDLRHRNEELNAQLASQAHRQEESK